MDIREIGEAHCVTGVLRDSAHPRFCTHTLKALLSPLFLTPLSNKPPSDRTLMVLRFTFYFVSVGYYDGHVCGHKM